MKPKKLELTRRQMIKASLAAGTAMVVGFHLPGCSGSGETQQIIVEGGAYMPNAWVMIENNDQVTIMVNHSEMGQGVLTALPMILADEMEADWSKVTGVHAPVADIFKNPMMNIQATGGSTSVQTTWEVLRTAGATVKALFVNAAASKWKILPDQCKAENGRVLNLNSNETYLYSELIPVAVKLPVPENVPLKRPSQFKLIGNNIPRLDTVLKLDGSAVFGMDVKIPDLLNASIIHPPVVGAQLEKLDGSAALKLPGVKHVLKISTGIVIVADTFWQANKAKEALKITWSKGKEEIADTEAIRKRWGELVNQEGDEIYELGDINENELKKGTPVEADYELPYQAHATQEPMNCTAHVKKDGCDIWAPTQNQGGARGIAALITGLDPESIKVYTTFLGGGFGRRAEIDFVAEAVEVSQALGKPVKVIWTREEDMTTDFYRPASLNRMRASIDSDGKPIGWTHKIIGADHFVEVIPKFIPAMVPGWFPRFLTKGAASIAGSLAKTFGDGKGLTGGAGPLPYDIKNVEVSFINDEIGIPVGFWRSVANSSNGFVVESFIDELAHKAGKDPYQYRYDLLKGNPRLQSTLKLVAEKSGWGSPAANGASRGITSHVFHDTLVSMVAEVTVDDEELTIHRIICAVDCGIVINPKIIKAQIESGVVFGLTATLKSSVTFTRGKPDQRNFDSFELLRMGEIPKVETYIVESQESPTGIGEVAVPVIAPAITNAIFAATGKRIRKIPLSKEDLVI